MSVSVNINHTSAVTAAINQKIMIMTKVKPISAHSKTQFLRAIMNGIAFAFLFCLYSASFAQNDNERPDSISFHKETKPDFGENHRTKRNKIHLELLGSAQLYSINYERIFFSKERFGVFARVGCGYVNFWDKTKEWNTSFVGCPLMVGATLQLNKTIALKAGMGITYFYCRRKSSYALTDQRQIISSFNSGIRINPTESFFLDLNVMFFEDLNTYRIIFKHEVEDLFYGGLGAGFRF